MHKNMVPVSLENWWSELGIGEVRNGGICVEMKTSVNVTGLSEKYRQGSHNFLRQNPPHISKKIRMKHAKVDAAVYKPNIATKDEYLLSSTMVL